MLGQQSCKVAFDGSPAGIIAGPGVEPQPQRDDLVELIDLGATLLDLANHAVPDDWDARSLCPALRGESGSHRDMQVSQLRDWRMICDGRHKLVRSTTGVTALFDLHADPEECRDIAEDAPAIVAKLGRRLERELPANPGSLEPSTL